MNGGWGSAFVFRARAKKGSRKPKSDVQRARERIAARERRKERKYGRDPRTGRIRPCSRW